MVTVSASLIIIIRVHFPLTASCRRGPALCDLAEDVPAPGKVPPERGLGLSRQHPADSFRLFLCFLFFFLSMNNVGERANTIYRRSGSSAEPSPLPAAEKIERADSRLALLLTETRRAAAKALKKRVREERRVCDGVGGAQASNRRAAGRGRGQFHGGRREICFFSCDCYQAQRI